MVSCDVSSYWHLGHPYEKDMTSRNLETKKKWSNGWPCEINSEFQYKILLPKMGRCNMKRVLI